jgi:hypothetical protein
MGCARSNRGAPLGRLARGSKGEFEWLLRLLPGPAAESVWLLPCLSPVAATMARVIRRTIFGAWRITSRYSALRAQEIQKVKQRAIPRARPHRHGFAISLPVRTRFAFRALSGIGGRRECPVRDAPAASRAKVKSTQVSHHRFTERVRHPLRDGLRLIPSSPR